MPEDTSSIQITLRNATKSTFSAFAQTEINSIVDAILTMSLSNKEDQDDDIDTDLDDIISEIKILEERGS